MRRSNRMASSLLLIASLFAIGMLVQRGMHESRVPRLPSLNTSAEAGSRAAEDHFSPGEDLERMDVARLEEAQNSVDIAMYAFTDLYIAQTVKRLADRGVKVRIYRDQEQYQDEQRHASKRDQESAMSLLSGSANVQIRVKGKRELMHLKAFVVDGKLLRDGSANWSPSGEKRQDNNAHFTADPAQVEAFQKNFEAMWARPENLVVQ